MEIAEFLEHVKAQLCGGHILKTFYNDVHTIVAHLVNDNPVLTQAGEDLKTQVEATVAAAGTVAADAEPAVEAATDAAIAGEIKDPALAGIAEEAANAVETDAAAAIQNAVKGKKKS